MTIDFTAHVRAESRRFAQALAAVDPQQPVPTCPDWTAADLVWHLGEVQLFWATVVAERLADPDRAEGATPPRPDDYAALLDFFDTSSAALLDALEQTPDDTSVWTWFDSDQSAGFVRRRQAHEALIHRIDAEATADAVTDVDPALATDGAKEVLDWMYSAPPAWAQVAPAGATGRVATTDTGAEWLVQLGSWTGTSPNSGKTYTDEGMLTVVDSGEVAFTISAGARDLDAWLWNRPTLDKVHLDGDCTAFEAIIRSGVQ